MAGSSDVKVFGSLQEGWAVVIEKESGGEAAGPSKGACCVDGDCTIELEDDCVGLGGEYQGNGTGCDPNPCIPTIPTGACCDGEDCTITTEEDCTGIYQGDDTTCDPNPCLPPCGCGGYPAFDGSGRYFLTKTITYDRSLTHTVPSQPTTSFSSEVHTVETYTVDPDTCEEVITPVTCSGYSLYIDQGTQAQECTVNSDCSCSQGTPNCAEDCSIDFNCCAAHTTFDSSETATTQISTTTYIDADICHPVFCSGSIVTSIVLADECTP